jgi:hypothetical protein
MNGVGRRLIPCATNYGEIFYLLVAQRMNVIVESVSLRSSCIATV